MFRDSYSFRSDKMTERATSVCNLEILNKINHSSIEEIPESYHGFCSTTALLLSGSGNLDVEAEFVAHTHTLCRHGLETLARDYFFKSLQENFETNGVLKFWKYLDYLRNFPVLKKNIPSDVSISFQFNNIDVQQVLMSALDELCTEKQHQEKCLLALASALLSYPEYLPERKETMDEAPYLLSKYQLMVSSVLVRSVPRYFPEILHWYFKERLKEFSLIMDEELKCNGAFQQNDDVDCEKQNNIDGKCEMDIDDCYFFQDRAAEKNTLVKSTVKVVCELRNLGFTFLTENAYASAIFLFLKAKIFYFAGDDYRTAALGFVQEWIQAVPLTFLRALLSHVGGFVNSNGASPTSFLCVEVDAPSEDHMRWHLMLECFAYETLQNLRLAKLFEIIIDYPDSSPALEDLKQCLDYTKQHFKVVESIVPALKYRLLTAGASTIDILHQYISTIKAMRIIDPANVFLESIVEPIRGYLRGRKDTTKCVMTMLIDGTGDASNGITGAKLLEELTRDLDCQADASLDDDLGTDDMEAWVMAECWEPDPHEINPFKCSKNQRKTDLVAMFVSIIGSQDVLVNEYRMMLAKQLLNNFDYNIDSDILTLELLKKHFGERSMHRCEIMLNDLIDSKRINFNVKAMMHPSHSLPESQMKMGASSDIFDVTIISSNFWPPIHDEDFKLPDPIEHFIVDYGKQFHEIKAPRKLLWKKSLGSVRLELQLDVRTMQFTVTPLHAAIIMQFQHEKIWTSNNLSVAIGITTDALDQRIKFWISKGIIAELHETGTGVRVYSLVHDMVDPVKSEDDSGGSYGAVQVGDEDEEKSISYIRDLMCKEMIVYEKFIMGMLTNFGGMTLDRIHNTLKMFCVADPPYDKSLQQLQNFLSTLVSGEKLEFKDGIYVLKK